MTMKTSYYLNSASTTAVDPDVADVIYTTIKNNWANPSDVYKPGRQSLEIIEAAQKTVADYIHAGKYDKIIFTGSGSEANNLALTGWYKRNNNRVVFSTPIEHKSIVAQPCVQPLVSVDIYGRVDLSNLKRLASRSSRKNYETIFSVGLVNNEIGTIQDIKTISEIIHSYDNCYLHVDATQGFAHCDIDVNGIDMLSASFHKIGLPKGIGMLYVRDGIDIDPIIYGGQQMYGLRAGTENVPYIAGVAHKFRNLANKVDDGETREQIKNTTKALTDRLLAIPGSRLNGATTGRVLGNINISFADIEGATLAIMLDVDGIYVSSGSACNSKSVDPSYVLTSINTPDEYLYGAIRITVNEPLTDEEIEFIVARISHWVTTLREVHQNREE